MKRTTILWTTLLLLTGGLVLYAQSDDRPRRRNPSPPPGNPGIAQPGPVPVQPMAPPLPGPNPHVRSGQLTRIQVDFFELACGSDPALIDLDKIGAANPSVVELRKRLAELGEARLLVRIDDVVDLVGETRLNHGTRVPTVQSVSVSPDSKTNPSVSYQSVGVVTRFSGGWRDENQPSQADISTSLEMSNVTKSTVEAGGVKLPAFQQFKLDKQVTLTSGQPILMMSNVAPTPSGDDKGSFVVTVIRLTAIRLSPPAAEKD